MFLALFPEAAAPSATTAAPAPVPAGKPNSTNLGEAPAASKADVDYSQFPGFNPNSELPGDELEPEPEETAAEEPAPTNTTAAAEEAGTDDGDAPELDSATVTLAKRMGLSDDDLAGFDDTQDLQRHLRMLDRVSLSRFRQQQPQSPAQQNTPAAPAPKPQASGEAAPESDSALKFEKYKLELDPEKYDEEVLKALNGLNDHYAARLEQLHTALQQHAPLNDRVTQLWEQQQRAYAAAEERELDAFFDSLGDDHAALFGKGEMSKLTPGSPQHQQRVQLWGEALALAQADQLMGRQPSSRTDLARRALGLLVPDQPKTKARQQLQQEVVQRRQQATARPASRNRKLTGVERAVARASAVLGDTDDGDFRDGV